MGATIIYHTEGGTALYHIYYIKRGAQPYTTWGEGVQPYASPELILIYTQFKTI